MKHPKPSRVTVSRTSRLPNLQIAPYCKPTKTETELSTTNKPTLSSLPAHPTVATGEFYGNCARVGFFANQLRDLVKTLLSREVFATNPNVKHRHRPYRRRPLEIRSAGFINSSALVEMPLILGVAKRTGSLTQCTEVCETLESCNRRLRSQTSPAVRPPVLSFIICRLASINPRATFEDLTCVPGRKRVDLQLQRFRFDLVK